MNKQAFNEGKGRSEGARIVTNASVAHLTGPKRIHISLGGAKAAAQKRKRRFGGESTSQGLILGLRRNAIPLKKRDGRTNGRWTRRLWGRPKCWSGKRLYLLSRENSQGGKGLKRGTVTCESKCRRGKRGPSMPLTVSNQNRKAGHKKGDHCRRMRWGRTKKIKFSRTRLLEAVRHRLRSSRGIINTNAQKVTLPRAVDREGETSQVLGRDNLGSTVIFPDEAPSIQRKKNFGRESLHGEENMRKRDDQWA